MKSNIDNEVKTNCPCRDKHDNCNLVAYSIYSLGLVACAGSSICPPCAGACVIANGLVLYSGMENCSSDYYYCLDKCESCC